MVFIRFRRSVTPRKVQKVMWNPNMNANHACFRGGRRKASRWPTTLSLGGLLSSVGCAACCALPIILAGTGLAGAWTLHLQLLVGPYEIWWLWGSLMLLGLGIISWGREMHRLSRRHPVHIPVITYAVTPSLLALGVFLLVSTLMVEHANLTDFL